MSEWMQGYFVGMVAVTIFRLFIDVAFKEWRLRKASR